MSCNCKRKIDLENKYGTNEPENSFQRIVRNSLKLSMVILVIPLVLVIAPIYTIIAFYKAFFGDGKVLLPNIIRKHLKDIDGQRLQNTYEHNE